MLASCTCPAPDCDYGEDGAAAKFRAPSIKTAIRFRDEHIRSAHPDYKPPRGSMQDRVAATRLRKGKPMQESVALLDLASAVAVDEIENWIDRLLGEAEDPDVLARHVATEYRIVAHVGGGIAGVQADDLGVVNPWHAERIRRTRSESGSAVLLRRPVIRGNWEAVEPCEESQDSQ